MVRKSPKKKVCVTVSQVRREELPSQPTHFQVESQCAVVMLPEAVNEPDFKVSVKKAKSESRQREVI